MYIENDEVQSGSGKGLEILTDAAGKFPLPTKPKPWVVLILGDHCFAFANKDALAASPKIEAKRYAARRGPLHDRRRSRREAEGEIERHLPGSLDVADSDRYRPRDDDGSRWSVCFRESDAARPLERGFEAIHPEFQGDFGRSASRFTPSRARRPA